MWSKHFNLAPNCIFTAKICIELHKALRLGAGTKCDALMPALFLKAPHIFHLCEPWSWLYHDHTLLLCFLLQGTVLLRRQRKKKHSRILLIMCVIYSVSCQCMAISVWVVMTKIASKCTLQNLTAWKTDICISWPTLHMTSYCYSKSRTMKDFLQCHQHIWPYLKVHIFIWTFRGQLLLIF